MIVWLEKSSVAKCFMLSARALCIIWGDTPEYWTWIPVSDSRFSEAAQLIDVCWLEIRGKIQSSMLTRKTTYAAFLVFKLADWSRGLGDPPQEASVAVGSQSSTKAVCLQPNMTRSRRPPWPRLRFFPIRNINRSAVVEAARAAALGEGGGTDGGPRRFFPIRNINRSAVVEAAPAAAFGEGGGTDGEAASHEAPGPVTGGSGGTDGEAASHEAPGPVTGGSGGTDVGAASPQPRNDGSPAAALGEAGGTDGEAASHKAPGPVPGGSVGTDAGAVSPQPRNDGSSAAALGEAASHEAPGPVSGGSGGTDAGAASPQPRNDGWMEILMGDFYNDEGEDGEVVMSFTEVKGGHWKKGLIVLGIEIRPKT